MSISFVHPVVLILLGLAAGCSSGRQPEARAVRVTIDSVDFKGVSTVFNLDVHNPYSVRLKTADLHYAIDIAGREFIRSTGTTEFDLPASSVGTVSLPVRMEYAELRENFTQLKDSSEIPYRLHGLITGTTAEGPWNVPVEHKGTLPLLRPPLFSVPRVKFADASLSGAKVALEVDVHNPNICSLGMGDVGYSMTVGGIPLGNVRVSSLGDLAARSSGKLSLVAEITTAGILRQMARGEKLGEFGMSWSGAVRTPYGRATLPPGHLGFKP